MIYTKPGTGGKKSPFHFPPGIPAKNRAGIEYRFILLYSALGSAQPPKGQSPAGGRGGVGGGGEHNPLVKG